MARRNNKKIFRIRRRYEYGEDLNKLSFEYRIPLSTVNKRKAADADRGDPWIKNSKTHLHYAAYVEGIEERKKALCKAITDKARAMTKHLEELSDRKTEVEGLESQSLEPDEYVRLSKGQEEAYILRTSFIEKYMDLRKRIEEISSEEELLDFERKKLDLEIKRLEVEEKRLELTIKKETNKRIPRRAEDVTKQDVSKVSH